MSIGVLIIAGARVGGSNLMKSIAKGSRSTSKFEMDIVKDWKLIDPTSNVCKYIPFYDHPNSEYVYDFNSLVNIDKVIERAKLFNKIVIMNRRDKVEQTESLYALKVVNDNRNYVHWDESCVDKESSLYSNLYRYNLEIDKCLSYLSNRLNIEMDYYEDVYKNKALNDKSIELDYSFFGKNRKLRRASKYKTIL